jgi:hypothetical protein
MAKFYTELDETLREFITAQKVFFVATAPSKGSINLSPKGLDSLRCLDNRTVAYLDVTGSGNETAAHLLEDGRMTMMFCSFSGKPLIVRLRGRGRVVHQRDGEWPGLYALFEETPGVRQIMVMEIESAQTSCGQGVPVYEFKHERDLLPRDAEARGPEGIEAYQRKHNMVSIDGLPTNLLPD